MIKNLVVEGCFWTSWPMALKALQGEWSPSVLAPAPFTRRTAFASTTRIHVLGGPALNVYRQGNSTWRNDVNAFKWKSEFGDVIWQTGHPLEHTNVSFHDGATLPDLFRYLQVAIQAQKAKGFRFDAITLAYNGNEWSGGRGNYYMANPPVAWHELFRRFLLAAKGHTPRLCAQGCHAPDAWYLSPGTMQYQSCAELNELVSKFCPPEKVLHISPAQHIRKMPTTWNGNTHMSVLEDGRQWGDCATWWTCYFNLAAQAIFILWPGDEWDAEHKDFLKTASAVFIEEVAIEALSGTQKGVSGLDPGRTNSAASVGWKRAKTQSRSYIAECQWCLPSYKGVASR